MTRPQTLMQTTIPPTLSTTPDTRLSGQWLVIARVIWATLVAITLLLFAWMLPAYFTQLQTTCTAEPCAVDQLTPAIVQILQAHGILMINYPVFGLLFTLFVTLSCLIVALLILLRRSDDWMALLVALVLVMAGTIPITYILQQSASVWWWPAFILNSLTYGAIFLCSSLFPDGRLAPRWVLWLPIVWLGWQTVFIIFYPTHSSFSIMLNTLVWACICMCYMVAQIYRYTRVSGPVQRQQTRWVVYGVSLTVITVIGLEVPSLFIPTFEPGSLYRLLSWYGILLAFIPFPLTTGLAILRSRLWDIDIVINQTVVYGLLTVALALVYFGSIVILQSLFHPFIGDGSPFAPIGSTLAIATLFQPLHKSIQTIIDRRFYRSKYLAEQTLQAFSTTLRDEMDLNHLHKELLEVVYETIQPAHISLWLLNPTPLHSQNTQTLPQLNEKERN